MAVAGVVFGKDAIQAQVVDSMKGMLGDNGSQAVQTMLKARQSPLKD
jgi:hypothetical protein